MPAPKATFNGLKSTIMAAIAVLFALLHVIYTIKSAYNVKYYLHTSGPFARRYLAGLGAGQGVRWRLYQPVDILARLQVAIPAFIWHTDNPQRPARSLPGGLYNRLFLRLYRCLLFRW